MVILKYFKSFSLKNSFKKFTVITEINGFGHRQGHFGIISGKFHIDPENFSP